MRGKISEVLVIIGAIPKTPNNIPHKGDRSAKKPIDINSFFFLAAAEKPELATQDIQKFFRALR